MTIYLTHPDNPKHIHAVSETGQYVADAADATVEPNLVWLTGPQCQVYTVDMPLKQTRQITKALPFALEEQLAQDIDLQHIVFLGKKQRQAYAQVISHDVMKSIQETGAQHAYYLPLSLPLEKSQATIAIIEEQAMVRLDEYQGFALPISALGLFLQRYKAQYTGLTVYGELPELIKLELESDGIAFNVNALSELVSHLEQAKPKFDLMTGPYKVKVKKTNTKLNKFKAPATLAAAIFVAGVSINWVNALQLSAKAEAIENASKEYYQQLFPGDNANYGMKRQFSNRLEDGVQVSNGESFTQILSAVGKQLVNQNNTETESIRYNKSNAELEIEVIVPNIGQLDQFKQTMAKQNYSVDIASANNEKGKTKGLLKVKKND